LTFFDFEEEKELLKALEAFQEKFNPFIIVNSDPKLLSYQIDLHGGLRKSHAVSHFLENKERI
jgi:hypothetical protein